MNKRPTGVDAARELREHASVPEVVLWSDLRNRQLGGLKFRRQQPIGPYVADFYCADARLVVELDGVKHLSSGGRDAARDRWMRAQGIETIRIPVPRFTKDRVRVLEYILSVAWKRIEMMEAE
ncbi:MAG: DUF559 domain-containing protein [Phycisphaeraceae bacterium]|nr:DUF559 domain-containing protein [Phycisphaeraceae bacterium]